MRRTNNAQRWEVVVTYSDGKQSRLSVRGRTEWKSRARAIKHADEFRAAGHHGVVSVRPTAVFPTNGA